LHGGTLNPLGILGAVTRHNGNAISGDTPVFLLLMNHLEKNLRRVAPQLRWIKIASQAMPLKDKIHATALLPNARIVMGYGLTEAMRTCLLAFGDHPDKLATDGRPCPGVRIQSVNEQGQPLAPTEVGEILISGVNLATGYWGKAEMWAEKFDGEWYKSGDLGYIDADGFLTLLGRKDQAINSGGKTIALSEVESRLRERILSTSFAVCGVPDKRNVLGDVIALCVEGKWNESKDWKDLRIELFENMDPALIPKDAYVFDAFPRTTNGKIQVIKLRESIEAGTAEKI
jgi:long-chain acyl-CoA synthetase